MRKSAPSPDRVRDYRRGQTAEIVAAAFLILKGHRILARRYKTALGEIDLITLKNRRVGFVEVKYRRTREDCEAAVSSKLRQRVRNASGLWFAKNLRYQGHDVGFDLVFVVPCKAPTWLKDAL